MNFGVENMKIANLLSIPKFKPMNEVFEIYGESKFKLDNRNIYYMGNGILISFCNKKFKVVQSKRIEYDDIGEYALRLSFFQNKNELELYYKIWNETYEFGYESLSDSIRLFDNINIGDTFANILKKLKGYSYREGEARGLTNGVGDFVFEYNFIEFDNCDFLFFGKSKWTKMTAFIYRFKDD
jgi:hypothetical protein